MIKSLNSRGLGKDYQRLCRQLSAIEWICQGRVMKRSYQRTTGKGLKTYGPYYACTPKVDNETGTVPSSPTQHHAFLPCCLGFGAYADASFCAAYDPNTC